MYLPKARPRGSRNDVTAAVERLGNPFSKGPYARNVWDMAVYDGQVYLGHGNSSNEEPEVNAGPVPIISYDPVTQNFENPGGFAVDDEQIDVFRNISGELIIPGHDPREDLHRLG